MIAMLVCLLAMLALQILTPYWWWVMIVPFAFGAGIATSGWRAMRTGVLAAGLLWLGAEHVLLSHGEPSHRDAHGGDVRAGEVLAADRGDGRRRGSRRRPFRLCGIRRPAACSGSRRRKEPS